MRRHAAKAAVGLPAACLAYFFYLYLTLPDVRVLATTNPPMTAFIELRAAEARAAGQKPRRLQHWIRYEAIPNTLRRAVLVAEDDAFWQHDGVDVEQLRKSIESNLEKGRMARGGSTITQQLAKNLYLSPSRNPIRKLREFLIARKLEAALSKRSHLRNLSKCYRVGRWHLRRGCRGAAASLTAAHQGPSVDLGRFLDPAAYRPLPSLVEAARQLLETGEITRIGSIDEKTSPTLELVSEIAREAAKTGTRRLVLLTGLPGTGKTLVGLQLAHARFLDDLAVERPDGKPSAPAVYLSGNGPLVEVLQYELRKAGGGAECSFAPSRTTCPRTRTTRPRPAGAHPDLRLKLSALSTPIKWLASTTAGATGSRNRSTSLNSRNAYQNGASSLD